MNFNAIDILLVLVILLNVVNGWRRGFILGLLDLLGWVVTLLAGIRFYRPVAQFLGPQVDLWSPVWDQPIAFILCAVAAGVVFHLITYLILRKLPKEIHERTVNRLLGIIPGSANGVILAAIVSALLLAVPLNETLSE